ncbi:FadR/GntR family transcriptional regulator [Jiangella anatolica]|uniref:FadR/GntR family transcriptional regulator n=1 Tax=Jiangella anatolica TaxID=2670374 RepID=UPI0013148F7D|nr:FadR/GntR family transcriptional regulator [Jiangella anatolica]
MAERIRADISKGGLQPGEELPSEAEYGERFEVSQRVVRDALRTLNNEGIISTRQGKRAVVGSLRPAAMSNYIRFLVDTDPSAIDELMDFRALLEGHAARLAAERVTDDDVARLRQAVAEVVRTGDDLEARVPADLRLHELIAQLSGNRLIDSMLEVLAETLAEERRRGAEIFQSAGIGHEQTNDQHLALVEAIAARDGDAAERCAVEIVKRAGSYWSSTTFHGQPR